MAGNAQTLQGVVTSDQRDKTITVSITYRRTHPLYRKQYSDTRKYTAHDEKNTAHLGDKVEIVACRPFSRTKTYKLVKVLEKAHGQVELKENLHEVKIEKNEGADKIAKRKAEEAATKAKDSSEEGEN